MARNRSDFSDILAPEGMGRAQAVPHRLAAMPDIGMSEREVVDRFTRI
jgi:hypothetical protein